MAVLIEFLVFGERKSLLPPFFFSFLKQLISVFRASQQDTFIIKTLPKIKFLIPLESIKLSSRGCDSIISTVLKPRWNEAAKCLEKNRIKIKMTSETDER